MSVDVMALNEQVKASSRFVDELYKSVKTVVVGQEYLYERILIGMLSNGHVLLEGLPGLAKTLTIKTFSDAIHTRFQRIQFTPDLLPADLIGTQIYNPKTGEFAPKKGPIFSNIILADEINRSPAKLQSALLEAMAERQVTIGGQRFGMADPFVVLATQNPIEQEGTYPLPEAQVDRFMLKVIVRYPTIKEEKEIVDRISMEVDGDPTVTPVIEPQDLINARQLVTKIYMDDKIRDYIVDIVFATRSPEEYGLSKLRPLIDVGASPRASISLTRAARAHAFIKHRGYVTPEDVKSIAMDVLRHRIIPSYEAEAEEMSSEQIVKMILDQIEVP
jgi:MoxR-like ATPase